MDEVERMTPEEVSKVLHTGVETIRAGLRNGNFTFGTAIQGRTGRWTYIIIKSKFLEYVNEGK